MRYLSLLASGADVICIQEARGSREDQAEIRDFLPGWAVMGTHMHDGLSGGSLFLLSPTIASMYPAPQLDAIVRGRIAILRLRAHACPAVDIPNLHLVDFVNLPLHVQFVRLRHALSPRASAHSILIGDMNLVAAGEGRLHVAPGSYGQSGRTAPVTWKNASRSSSRLWPTATAGVSTGTGSWTFSRGLTASW